MKKIFFAFFAAAGMAFLLNENDRIDRANKDEAKFRQMNRKLAMNNNVFVLPASTVQH